MSRAVAVLLVATLAVLGVATRFELDAKVETKMGLREYAETTYSYYETRTDGTRVLRWRRTERGYYSRHWISPSGRLWIMTESLPGPGGGGSTTLRSVNGDLLAWWQTYAPSRFRMATGKTEPAAAKAEAKVLRPNVAEQLAISLSDGSTANFTAFWPKGDGHPIALRSRSGAGTAAATITEQILSDPTYDPPTVESPFHWRMPISVWRAKSRLQNRRDQAWLLPLTAFPGQLANFDLDKEQRLDHSPDSIQATPGNFLVLFDFDASMARMTIRDWSGKFVKPIDLLKLGGFASPAEAKASLTWRRPLSHLLGGWTPLSQAATDEAPSGREQIELWDKRQSRYTITIGRSPNTVEAEVFRGLAANRPKELGDPHAYTILSEKSASSPDGKYRLRFRKFAGKKIPDFTRMTLLARVPDGKRTSEIELWSAPVYFEVPFFAVTNSGRAVFYELGHMPVASANSGPMKLTDYVALRVIRPDGMQVAAPRAVPDWGFNSLADARAKIDFANTKIESIGQPLLSRLANLDLRTYPVERITVALKDGGRKVFYLLTAGATSENYFTNGDQPWEREMIRAATGGKK